MCLPGASLHPGRLAAIRPGLLPTVHVFGLASSSAGCRGAIKLYSDFLQSDIIVASPIALATKLSDEVEEGGPADFLSSIEIAIVDRADVLLMQNWSHVATGAELTLLCILGGMAKHFR